MRHLEQLDYLKLLDHFKLESTFNIRWKKTWRKDFISPGVYAGQFETDFTGGDLKKFVARDWITKSSYTEPHSGFRRTAILFKDKLLPQQTTFKKIMCDEFFSDLQKSLLVVFILILAICVLVTRKALSSEPICTQTIVTEKEVCHEEKHPIAGAGLGWLVFGPVGAVVGAVAGSNPDRECHMEKQEHCAKYASLPTPQASPRPLHRFVRRSRASSDQAQLDLLLSSPGQNPEKPEASSSLQND